MIGFLSAWVVVAAVFFIAEETNRPIAYFFSDCAYYIVVAPVLLPAFAVVHPITLIVRGVRKWRRRSQTAENACEEYE